MNTKLTLSMDSAVISAMKCYAAENKSSLSQMVESFFKHLLSEQSKDRKISPLVMDLSGIIPAREDDKESYISYLESKYE